MEEVVKLFSIDAHFALPSYLQDKRKVERCIQNLNREFVDHLGKFSERLKGKPGQYRDWFNYSRFHGGVKTFPAELHECNVRNLTWQSPKLKELGNRIFKALETI